MISWVSPSAKNTNINAHGIYTNDTTVLVIIHIKTMGPVRDLQDNFEVVAGTGDECTPGERDLCGDGKPAMTARFLHPKGNGLIELGVFPRRHVSCH